MFFNFDYFDCLKLTRHNLLLGEGTGIVAKTTVRLDQDGLAHAESFIETFDMDKDIQEKRKRTRKSRERRSNRGLAKTAQLQSDETNIIDDRNIHLPSAPTFNQINQQPYGKIVNRYRY